MAYRAVSLNNKAWPILAANFQRRKVAASLYGGSGQVGIYWHYFSYHQLNFSALFSYQFDRKPCLFSAKTLIFDKPK